MPAAHSTDATPLAPLPRLAAAGACWTLLFLATPGILDPDGSVCLAILALVPWAAWCSRPGPRAFWIEWLAAGVGLSAQTVWSTYVLWITLLAMAIVPALYMAVAGAVLRRLARAWPLWLAAPAAWIGLETLRTLIEPPFGLGWMRLGHHAHAHGWMLGAMRIVGVGGVGFALAALAGTVADLLRLRREQRRFPVWAVVPFAAAIAVAICTCVMGSWSLPAMQPGPRVLLVQPGFEQHRKMDPPSPESLFDESVELTRRGLREAQAAGRPPDLVAWGETMFPWPLGAPDLLEAWDRGARSVPWGRWQLAREDVEGLQRLEREVVRGELLGAGGRRRVIPEGATFLSGVEEYVERDGAIRRTNAVVVWNARGERIGRGGKIHLVPGGEALCGLERLAWVRDTAFALAGYVPDLVAEPRAAVVAIPLQDGRQVRVGLTVCFDNAFDGPYTEPLRRGPLDLHLVVSNEAWYRESFEYDQMIAFSHCLAALTARAVVRATNAGVSVVIGPDGREIARLRAAGGRDRVVAGTLLADVPVPAEGAGATPYVRFEPWWLAGWIALPALLFLAGRRRERGYCSAPAR